MVEKGYAREYAERIFKQIQGFGEYGFPESHAAGFALLAYVSSWIKCHHPDAFLAACSTPSRWASTRRRSWCATRASTASRCVPVDVAVSDWESTLARRGRASTAQPVRLGLDRVKGLAEDAGAAHRRRARRGALSPASRTWRGAPRLDAHALAALAEAGALQALTGHRHQAAWAVAGIDTRPTEMLRATRSDEAAVAARRAERGRGDARRLPRPRPDAEAPSARAAARRSSRHSGSSRRRACAPTRTAGWRAPAAWSRTGSGPRRPRARSSSRSRTRPARSTSSSGRASPRRSASRCSARPCSPSSASGSARATATQAVMHLVAARMIDHTPLLQRPGQPQPRLSLAARARSRRPRPAKAPPRSGKIAAWPRS